MFHDRCNFNQRFFSAKLVFWGVIPMQTAPWTAMLEIWYVASAELGEWSGMRLKTWHHDASWNPGGLGPELFLVDFLCRLGLGRNSGGCTFYTSDGCSLHLNLSFVAFRCVWIAVVGNYGTIFLTCFAVESRNLRRLLRWGRCEPINFDRPVKMDSGQLILALLVEGIWPTTWIWLTYNKVQLAGGSIFFYFHLYLGKNPTLTNTFQRGWNHQLDSGLTIPCSARF